MSETMTFYKKSRRERYIVRDDAAGVAGFEPTNDGVKVRCLNRLGYTPISKNGEPTGIRTPDTRLRRPLLYPTEL